MHDDVLDNEAHEIPVTSDRTCRLAQQAGHVTKHWASPGLMKWRAGWGGGGGGALEADLMYNARL